MEKTMMTAANIDLSSIAKNWTEEEYRKYPAMDFSMISKFSREGFEKLSSLNESINTTSLSFGSAVDCLITEGMEAFNKKFVVADFKKVSEPIKNIVEFLFNHVVKENQDVRLPDISVDDVVDACDEFQWQQNWKDLTRYEKVITLGSDYFDFLKTVGDRKLLEPDFYQKVIEVYYKLKESDTTKFYFNKSEGTGIDKFYQLKFAEFLNGIEYKGMFDCVILDHYEKTIQIVDLKTSSEYEWNFYKSINKYNYHMQARLYTRILKEAIKKSDYFKSFTILPFQFIVINKFSMTPLIWQFDDCFKYGTLEYGETQKFIFKDPEEIALELKYYIENKPLVPKGINIKEPNDLINYLNKL